MNFDRQQGFLYGAAFTCLHCGGVGVRRASKQVFCSRACWKAYHRAHDPRRRHKRLQHRQGTMCPDLKLSCDRLEELCRRSGLAGNWPAVIARFTAPAVPGYRNLTKLTQDCVRAKLKIGVERG